MGTGLVEISVFLSVIRRLGLYLLDSGGAADLEFHDWFFLFIILQAACRLGRCDLAPGRNPIASLLSPILLLDVASQSDGEGGFDPTRSSRRGSLGRGNNLVAVD